LLRYWTNDITNIYYDKSAKRTHVKMGPIIGRSDDMLIIRGVNLFHTQVGAALENFIEFSSNYQLVVTHEQTMDDVEVRVEINDDLFSALGKENQDALSHEKIMQAHERLQKKLKDNIGLTMKLIVSVPGTIPRSEGGKLNRILDLRKAGVVPV